MNILLTKLDSIASETGEGTQQNKSKAAGDEFKRLKAHITSDVKEIRELLKERDVLLERPNTAGTKATVQLSHKIRMQLKGVREDANKLRELQRKEVSKAKGKAAAIQQAEQRQDLVELVFKHVEDCENLVRSLLLFSGLYLHPPFYSYTASSNQERRRFGTKNSEARTELFSGGK